MPTTNDELEKYVTDEGDLRMLNDSQKTNKLRTSSNEDTNMMSGAVHSGLGAECYERMLSMGIINIFSCFHVEVSFFKGVFQEACINFYFSEGRLRPEILNHQLLTHPFGPTVF